MSESLTADNKTKIAAKKSGKNNGFNVFLNMCKEEYGVQYPEQNLNEEEFQKKCTNRWKNMTKKEKRQFDNL